MKMGLPLVLVSLIANPVLASTSAQASKVQHYLGICLDIAHLTDVDSNCEVSAVVNAGHRLIFASDKPIPGHGTSPIFSIALPDASGAIPMPLDFSQLNYERADLIAVAQKLEGLTQTLDPKPAGFTIAMNAFTRGNNVAANRILYWPTGSPQKARPLGDEMTLRTQIFNIVGTPFFQLEGIAATPDNWLLLGIRKQGDNSKSASPVFTILKAPFKVERNQVLLTDRFELAYQFNPHVAGDDRPLGLSGLEYDRFNDRLLATTSYEDGKEIGGYLWVLPKTLLEQKNSAAAQVVRNAQGIAVRFDNKPEGVEALNKCQVLVVHDDDKVQIVDSENGRAKKANEFVYSIVDFCP
ncbi:hypothetical protein [Pseudomonas putida]